MTVPAGMSVSKFKKLDSRSAALDPSAVVPLCEQKAGPCPIPETFVSQGSRDLADCEGLHLLLLHPCAYGRK